MSADINTSKKPIVWFSPAHEVGSRFVTWRNAPALAASGAGLAAIFNKPFLQQLYDMNAATGLPLTYIGIGAGASCLMAGPAYTTWIDYNPPSRRIHNAAVFAGAIIGNGCAIAGRLHAPPVTYRGETDSMDLGAAFLASAVFVVMNLVRRPKTNFKSFAKPAAL